MDKFLFIIMEFLCDLILNTSFISIQRFMSWSNVLGINLLAGDQGTKDSPTSKASYVSNSHVLMNLFLL